MNLEENLIPIEVNLDKDNFESSEVIIDLEGPAEELPMYKKVKLSEILAKKIPPKHNDVENGKDKKHSTAKHKRDRARRSKEDKDSKSDDIEESKEPKQNKRSRNALGSKKKTTDKAENNSRCSICKKTKGSMILCDYCPRSYHLECINLEQEDVPKGDWYCEKCKDKKHKVNKKKKKKDDKKQTKLDNLGSADKKSSKPPRKQKDDLEKKLQEFSKRYPQYIQKGKVKFPIEDRLLIVYAPIFESAPKTVKPQAKKGVIPPDVFGDIMQIWNFFYNYSDLFKFEDIAKEEIYAALAYQGSQYLLLLNDMHQGLLSLFLQEFRQKNRFETQKDEQEYPFFVMLKNFAIEELNGDELTGFWTEFARNLARTPNGMNYLSMTGQKNFEMLAKYTPLDYNALDYKVKTKVLTDLIELICDTELFRDFMHQKMEEVNLLVSEKNKIIAEIKQDETDLRSERAKHQELSDIIAKEEAKRALISRPEYARNLKNIENDKREVVKTLSNINKLEGSIQKKKNRLHKITSGLMNPVQTAYLIGQDCNKSEYWLFYSEPNRVYVKYTTINPDGEETWHYYDTQEEIDQLQKSLNPRGVREKNLLESLENLLKNKLIELKDDDVMEQTEKQMLNDNDIDEEKPKNSNKNMDIDHNQSDSTKYNDQIEEKTTTSTLSTSKPNGDSLDFWFGKVLEYEMIQTNEELAIRTTRRQKQFKKNEDENSYKNFKNFSLEKIKERILNTEQIFSEYLNKWGSRWAKPIIKEEIFNQIEHCNSPNDVAVVLLRLNEEWHKCESLKKKAGYELEVEEEEQPTKAEKGDEKEEDGEEYYFSGANGKLKKQAENAPKKGELKLDMIDESQYRIKRISLKLWGMNNEKLKRCWILYTTNVDNLAAAYFATVFFCDNVVKYSAKKTKQYFSEGRMNRDAQRKQQHHQKEQTMKAETIKSDAHSDAIRLEDIDQFRFTRSQAKGLREADRPTQKQKIKNKYIAPTRRKIVDEDEDENENQDNQRSEYNYISQNEKTRSKQDKLNELIAMQDGSTRRSERNLNKKKKNSDEDFYENKAEPVAEDPSFVKCQTCGVKYRLEDIGLKAQPESPWQCFDCLEKLTAQRRTRSTTRRLGN